MVLKKAIFGQRPPTYCESELSSESDTDSSDIESSDSVFGSVSYDHSFRIRKRESHGLDGDDGRRGFRPVVESHRPSESTPTPPVIISVVESHSATSITSAMTVVGSYLGQTEF